MTLIITELSKYGIIMVADSAVTMSITTPTRKVYHQVLNGVRKLQVIPYLSAGISVWGLGSIPLEQGELPTDIWLEDFIDRNKHIESLDVFANTLANELQGLLNGVAHPIGFHLAGYVHRDDKKLPTFYHVRNVDGDYQKYNFHDFIPGQDYPPREIDNDNEQYITRNGDYGAYAALATVTQMMLPQIQSLMGLEIPHPSLIGRLKYHKAWVTFISDIYESSGLLRTIGGNVTALGIYPDGNIVYLPG